MYELTKKSQENNRPLINQYKSGVIQNVGFVDNRSQIFPNNKTIQRGGKNSKLAPPDNNLLPWDSAVSVGYHSTKAWAAIKESGEFRPGGGRLGSGIYAATNQRLATMYGSIGSGVAVTLEVGFKGDFKSLVTRHLSNVSEYNPEMEGDYDVIYVDNSVLGQACFKMNGPSDLNADNIRVREVKS